MAFHLGAYFVALGNTVDTDVPAITDGILAITNGHFIPWIDLHLFAAYGSAVTLTRVKLTSGTIRQVNPTYIRPINANLLPPSNPNIAWYRRSPFRVRAHEELQALATDSAAGPNNAYVGVWLEDNYQAPPQGDIYVVRYTSTTAAVAQAWTQLAITFETGLPVGTYTVVDCTHQAANGIFNRMVFDNQYLRPGSLCISAVANRLPYVTDRGAYGVWGQFSTYSLPRIEHINNGTDNSHEGYMSVVKAA